MNLHAALSSALTRCGSTESHQPARTTVTALDAVRAAPGGARGAGVTGLPKLGAVCRCNHDDHARIRLDPGGSGELGRRRRGVVRRRGRRVSRRCRGSLRRHRDGRVGQHRRARPAGGVEHPCHRRCQPYADLPHRRPLIGGTAPPPDRPRASEPTNAKLLRGRSEHTPSTLSVTAGRDDRHARRQGHGEGLHHRD